MPQLGAVDILRTPIASQQDRLATLWQHAVRKGREQSALVVQPRGPGESYVFPLAADANSEASLSWARMLERIITLAAGSLVWIASAACQSHRCAVCQHQQRVAWVENVVGPDTLTIRRSHACKLKLR